MTRAFTPAGYPFSIPSLRIAERRVTPPSHAQAHREQRRAKRDVHVHQARRAIPPFLKVWSARNASWPGGDGGPHAGRPGANGTAFVFWLGMRIRSALVGSFALCTYGVAQCSNLWAPIGPLGGVGGPVHAAIAWDPDGPGPLAERLVVGGEFSSAGNVIATNIAVWDPTSGAWSALGSGCNASVRALAVLPNGRLVAGGQFSTAGGVSANRIAQWDGNAWTPLGSGSTSYPVSALAVLPNGDLIAGGAFATMGGVTVNGVARWDGSTWSALGVGLPNHSLFALTVLPNADIVAGGYGPGSGFPNLARWNGVAWSTFGVVTSGPYFGVVTSLAAAPNGDLLVGGGFTAIDSVAANGVARWNGSAWAALGTGAAALSSSSGVNALQVLPNGEVVVGGRLGVAGGAAVDRVARWNGSTWSALGSPMRGPTHLWPSPLVNQFPYVQAVATFANGAIFAAGSFTVAGAAAAQNVARWDGATWSALSTGNGLDGIEDLLVLPGGDVVAVGNFLAAGPVLSNGVARWNGTAWSTFGSSGMNAGGVGLAVERLPNGDLVVAGSFTSIGGVAANNVARWNGTQWAPVGALPSQAGDAVHALVIAPNGTLYAGGYFHTAGGVAGLASWNGTAWSVVPGMQTSEVYALTFLPDGRLVAGGALALPTTVAAWNGAVWTAFGNPGDTDTAVYSLAVLPNGDLVSGGQYGTTFGGRVRRWNGTSWATLGGFNSQIETVHVLPNGDLLAGGWFGYASNVPAAGLARWNGTSWAEVAGGIGGSWRRANVLASTPSGEVWVGGSFCSAGGVVAGGLARLTTTCAATAQVLGAGCDGDVVTATLPWTGSTWRAEASGLPTAAVVGIVNGFATSSLPLAAVFATALPGCTLHVQPDYVDFVLAANGTAAVQFVLPNTPTLAGVVFHHQMVSIALDASLAVTATNSLQLSVGSF